MTKNLAPKYNHLDVEQGKYAFWYEQDCFKAQPQSNKPKYTIVIPPPNVTGKLHLGHAWDTSLQDIIIRMKRMQGFDALWLPGMDHAGIATQAKVDARLKEQGVSRYDIGREAFLEKAWEWKEEYAGFIRQQWEKMGLSLDYSRERFTLDEGLSKAVRKVFVQLYEKGLIYRGERIINWDPAARTALSDIEVIHKEIEGAFYHFKYMIEGTNEFLEVATTRPETMFGDVAVAVHPEDERYQHLLGKNVLIPGNNKPIPVIADEYVEMDFGTGAVKITPAHDPNDFEVGNRHDLARPICMNLDGTMNELAGKYNGMDRFDARRQLVADLEEAGLVVKIEKHVHSVGHSERTDAVVEPYLSTQWFVKMEELAARSVANQSTDNKVNFVPDRFENTFLRWMENIHDWCISRQLWWGHQIPAWYHKETGEMYVGEEAPADIENWNQDEDVLDTWFSSALWPFTTLGWPDVECEDFKAYFPTDTLVTGYDIIFFWVARMIFQSLEFTGKRPFKDVLLHGLIRDEQGRKMSKSLGNGIDPMDVIDKYGADALRWFLSNGSTAGQDLRFSYDKMDSAWNFINKIWNASRYVIMNLDQVEQPKLPELNQLTLADKWILSRLNKTVEQVTHFFDVYDFGEAGRAMYTFIWDDFCDWYIEMSKEILNGEDEQAKVNTQNVLAYVLDQTLRLLHPVMPFVTEKIWLSMPHDGQSLVNAEYPVVHAELENQAAEAGMDHLIGLIKAVRNIRSEAGAPMSSPVDLLIKTDSTKLMQLFNENRDYIDRFCHPANFELGADVEAPKLSMSAVITDGEIYIPLAELVNLEDEIARLEKEEAKYEQEVNRVVKKLQNERFVSNAPEEVVAAERAKQTDYEGKLEATKRRLADIKSESK